MAERYFVALDVGEKRTGIAVAERSAAFARPLKAVDSQTLSSEMVKILQEYPTDTLIVGYPRNQDGSPTKQTAWIETFIKNLHLPETIKVVWQDESLTSHNAEAELSVNQKSFKKGDVDALAATLILEDYLREHA